MRHLQKAMMILLFIFLIGCSHTKIIKTYELEKNTALPKIHKYDRAQLTFANGETRHVKKLIASPDSSTYFDIEKKEDVQIATHEISSMYYHDWVRGGLRLGGLGLITGATFAYLDWHSVYDDESFEECSWVCIPLSFYVTILGGIGGLAGFLTGAFIGVDTTYEFQHDQVNEKPKNINYKNIKHINKE